MYNVKMHDKFNLQRERDSDPFISGLWQNGFFEYILIFLIYIFCLFLHDEVHMGILKILLRSLISWWLNLCILTLLI